MYNPQEVSEVLDTGEAPLEEGSDVTDEATTGD